MINSDFAETVHERRRELKLTLQFVATRVGTSKGYMSGVEHRKVNPPSPTLVRKMAKVLGLDYIELQVLACIEKAPKVVRHIIREGALAVLDANRKDKKPLAPKAFVEGVTAGV